MRARARTSSAVMFAALAIREVVSTCDPPGSSTPPRPPAPPPNICGGDGTRPDRAAADAADALVLATLAATSLGSIGARLGAAQRRIPWRARSTLCEGEPAGADGRRA